MMEQVGDRSRAGSSHDVLDAGDLSGRQKYRLLTSLVVPRPIAWVATRSATGVPNLAPFSYFNAVASDPMLVAVSIGTRAGRPKDTLQNIRETGVFCVHLVTERQLEAMNLTSGEYPAAVNEFEIAGLRMERASKVDAPCIAEAPAVLECRSFEEVALGSASTTLVIGEVLAVRLSPEARGLWDRDFLDVRSWVPVGRLWGGLYSFVRETCALARPTEGTK